MGFNAARCGTVRGISCGSTRLAVVAVGSILAVATGCGGSDPPPEERFGDAFEPVSESLIKIGDDTSAFLVPSDYSDGATTAANVRVFAKDLRRARKRLDAIPEPGRLRRARAELSNEALALARTLDVAAERAEVVGVSAEPAEETVEPVKSVRRILRKGSTGSGLNQAEGDLGDLNRRIDERKAPPGLRAEVRQLDSAVAKFHSSLNALLESETFEVARRRALKVDVLALAAHETARRALREASDAGYRTNFEQDLLLGPLHRMRDARKKLAGAIRRSR